MKWLDSVLSTLLSPLLVLGLHYPFFLPPIGWIFVGILRRDAAEWTDRGAWADDFVTSLLEDLSENENAEAKLRSEPQRYRRDALRFFKSRLPLIVPPERLHEVYLRLLRHIDRRVSFFERAHAPNNPPAGWVGQPVTDNKADQATDRPGNNNKTHGDA